MADLCVESKDLLCFDSNGLAQLSSATWKQVVKAGAREIFKELLEELVLEEMVSTLACSAGASEQLAEIIGEAFWFGAKSVEQVMDYVHNSQAGRPTILDRQLQSFRERALDPDIATFLDLSWIMISAISGHSRPGLAGNGCKGVRSIAVLVTSDQSISGNSSICVFNPDGTLIYIPVIDPHFFGLSWESRLSPLWRLEIINLQDRQKMSLVSSYDLRFARKPSSPVSAKNLRAASSWR